MRDDTSRYAVLGMLSIRPMSGYDIKQAIGESVGYFWNESYGRIYPSLQRLAAEGLARRKTERRDGRPERQIYSLTSKGRRSLERWLALPIRKQKPRSELLLKLFFGRHLPAAAAVRLVEQYRQEQVQSLAAFRSLEREVKAQRPRPPDQPFWLITIRFGEHNSRAAIEWCDETLQSLTRDARGATR
jgi:DNA-binding PadR family transcriptional regulator